MKNEMPNEFEQFKTFVEKMNELIEAIKSDKDVKSGKFKLEEFDLRFTASNNGDIFSIPKTFGDYFVLWEFVKERRNLYLENEKNADELFFDVYWNDVDCNSAFYDNKVLWVFFKENNVIEYSVYSYDENLETK